MLRISVVDSPTQRRLVLDGALVPPWVAELRTAWMKACVRRQGRKIVFDFTNLTYISAEGESALWEMMNRGVSFFSGGVLTRHILQQLRRRKKAQVNSRVSPSTAEEERRKACSSSTAVGTMQPQGTLPQQPTIATGNANQWSGANSLQ